MSPPATMTATCTSALGTTRSAHAAPIAIAARNLPEARPGAMPQSAFATTATAATFSPCSQPASATSNVARPYANSTIASAEGSVKPIHARRPPSHPARIVPIAMPTWLLAGPGRNWHSATRSA